MAESKNYFITKFYFFKAVFEFALLEWSILLFGWIWFTGSFLFDFYVVSSGSMLVCSALVCELVFQNKFLEVLRNIRKAGAVTVRKNITGDITTTAAIGLIVRHRRMGAIIKLGAHYNLFEATYGGEQVSYIAVFYKIEKLMMYFMIITAICGTVLWGYGDIIIQNLRDNAGTK